MVTVAQVQTHRASRRAAHLSCSYLKVPTINGKKTLELAVRSWNSRPNLLHKKPEESTHAENEILHPSLSHSSVLEGPVNGSQRVLCG